MKQQYIFIKHYGAEAANNSLLRLDDNHYVLFYGFGHDPEMSDSGYNWRKDYDHQPTLAEIKADIEGLINGIVAKNIREGFEFDGDPVWLSEENQLNFCATHTVPVRFKLGEREDGTPVYRTFKLQRDLTEFNRAVSGYINECLTEGWDEKDSIDYSVFEEALK